MGKKANKKPVKTGAYSDERILAKQPFFIVGCKTARDLRMNSAVYGTYCRILSLPKNWRITSKGTAAFFGLSPNTFKEHIKTLCAFGYLTKIKVETNVFRYEITDPKEDKIFNPLYIKIYTLEELDYHFKNSETPEKYKPWIKSVYKQRAKFEAFCDDEYKDLVKKLDPKDIDLLNDDDLF